MCRVMEEMRNQALQEGIEQGISGFVITLRELSASKEFAVQKLVERYGLTPHVAEEKVNQFWGQ